MKNKSIGSWIFAGLLLGTFAGVLAKTLPLGLQPALDVLVEQIKPLGGLFNRIIFMVVVPIVFCSLVSGISSLGGGKIGKIGAGYYKLATVFVLVGGIIAFAGVLVFKPGHGVAKPANVVKVVKQEEKPALQRLVEIVPANPLEAIVNTGKGGLIPVMVFAAFVGFALIGSGDDSLLRKLNDEVLAASIRIVDFAMWIAPVSVGILMFTTVVTTGIDMILSLLGYIGVIIGALAVQQFVVFGITLVAAGKPALSFFLQTREVMATALATASAAVTTPVAMRVAEESLKLKPEESRFVLTLGITGAKTGTAIFLIVATVFIAQVAGVDISFGDYAVIGFTAFVSGIVTAGIPGASIPVIVGILVSIGVPAEEVGLIVAVDRILDMLRTTVNVTANLVIAQVIANKE